MSKKRPSSTSASLPGARPILILATAATALWVGGLAAYALGFHARIGPFGDEAFALGVLALLGLAPIGLIWVGAYALLQAARLLAESARLQRLSEELLAPAALAAVQAGSAIGAVRHEIDRASAAAERARSELLGLREAMATESETLTARAADSAREAASLVQSLGQERQELGAASGLLESRVGEIHDVIGRHARMVAEASDLARAHIHEAEAALGARAADLAVAASRADQAARTAESDLARQAARLEQAGVTLGEQTRAVEDGLGRQRAALIALGHDMRADQEDLAVHFESQRAQLLEILRQSEQGAMHAGDVAGQGAQALRDLMAAVADQLRAMGEQAQVERERLGEAAAQSLSMLSRTASDERQALEDGTRRAVETLSAAAEAAHHAAGAAGGDLAERARAASGELEAIDAAFQERVKRNYEMLSEAVRLMGVLSGAQPRAEPLAPAPRLPLRARDLLSPPSPLADDLGLRPRLKLTGLPEDEPLSVDDDDAPSAGAADFDSGWRELVAALQDDTDEAGLEHAVIGQIEALGIDAAALIPRRRLDDVARLYEGGDVAGGRDLVQRLAPAAVRKLARGLLSDGALRAPAARLSDRYRGPLSSAAGGGEGLKAVSLLSSDAGRAFLLLDSAAGDLGGV